MYRVFSDLLTYVMLEAYFSVNDVLNEKVKLKTNTIYIIFIKSAKHTN